MTPFWIALQFLTVFPVQLKQLPSKQQNAQSLLFYPLIGLLIGAVLLTVVSVLHAVPIMLQACITLILWIWLTGGLHLDGLADTADAWVGGFGDKARTLQIMKDPSCGPIGVLSLLLISLLKFSCLYVLLEQKLQLYLLVLPVLGRLAALFLFLTTPYVRERGVGSSMGALIPQKRAWLCILLGLLAPLLIGWVGFLSGLVAIPVLLYLRSKFMQRIDGITGDTIGASIEIVEAASLLSLVLFSFYL